MKRFKAMIFSMAMLFFLTSASQCTNAQKLEQEAPIEFGEVYYQKLAQAIKDLESSISLYIPLKEGSDKTIVLDSVYFKGKSAKLKVDTQNQSMYVARFITNSKQTPDIILSSDMKEESENKLPKKEPEIPFQLKPNECVISYEVDGEVKYYKISNIKEKRLKEVPMSPRNNP